MTTKTFTPGCFVVVEDNGTQYHATYIRRRDDGLHEVKFLNGSTYVYPFSDIEVFGVPTTFRVTASWEPSPLHPRADCTSAETLGEAFNKRWATREQAEAVAAELQRELPDFDLHHTTLYSVEEVEGV